MGTMVQEGKGSYETLLGRKIKIKGAAELESYVKKAPDNCKGVLCIVSTSWCGPCRQLAQQLDAALGEAALANYMLLCCDGDEDEDLNINEKRVRDIVNYRGYPSIYMFAPGNPSKFAQFRLNDG